MAKRHDLDTKLRILFIPREQFPPFRADVNVLFAQEMVGRGHCIDWIMQSEGQCDASFQTTWCGCNVWVGVTNTGTSVISRLRKNIHGIVHDFKMFSLVRKHKYDFIQVRDKFISSLLAILVAKTNRLKFIYWLSHPFPEHDLYAVRTGIARYPLYYFLRGMIRKFLLYRVIMPRADHIFVQSEQMKKDVAMMDIPEEKMTAVPMGVSLEAIPNQPAEIGTKVSKDVKAVLYLGTLDKGRRIDFLLRVFEKVLRLVPSAKLYMVGDGDDPFDKQMLKDEALRLGIRHSVVFTGFVPRQDVWHYVSEANVCVSPFYPTPILNSTSPTKLIEYMAMGKPVVANEHPEQRLVISESGGGICVAYEENAFADAIVNLLSDLEKAKEMGQKGRRYVEKHRTYEIIANVVESEYLRIRRAKAEIS